MQFSLLCFFIYIPFAIANDKPTVFVSIIPQKFFVQQISKDLVNVEVMVQPGASPATYEPKPSQMAKLSSSAIYFAVGVPFEKAWLARIIAVNPDMKVVRTDRDIEKIAMVRHHHEAMKGEGHREAEHHEDGHHEPESSGHVILDPHIWLSPGLVKKQALAILEGLKVIAPRHAVEFLTNYTVFLEKIDALDVQLQALLQDRKGMRFMVFHPTWGYFAKDYGLEQVPIEIEGKAPKPAQLLELIRQARENDIHIIFVQPQFSQKSAEVVAREIKGKAIFVDPLAEDWFANMRDVAEKFKLAVK
ncbi:MAG: zinc ABC transporter substrate-binding protein [Desulforhopalus sp.]